MKLKRFKQSLKSLEKLNSKSKLRKVDKLLKRYPNNSYLLVLRGKLIQRQKDDNGPSLKDAENNLTDASILDPDSVSSLIELGFFNDVLMVKPKKAKKYFDRAITLAAHQLVTALVGRSIMLEDKEMTGDLDKKDVLKPLKLTAAIIDYCGDDITDNFILDQMKEIMEKYKNE